MLPFVEFCFIKVKETNVVLVKQQSSMKHSKQYVNGIRSAGTDLLTLTINKKHSW